MLHLRVIDRVLFISSQPGGKVDRAIAQKYVIDAMKEDGVKFVAYTSFPKADTSTSALAGDHRATEEAIKEADIAHAFLRDNWYLENEMAFLQNGAANKDALYWANHRAGWALEREYAEAAAKLAKDPTQITLLDIFNAINMDHDLLHIDSKTNPECIVGGNIQNTLNDFYSQIQNSAFQKMSTITLQDVIGNILDRQAKKDK